MANPEHVSILLEGGVKGWNKWRDENPDITPDLDRFMFQRLSRAEVSYPFKGFGSYRGEISGLNLSKTSLFEACFDGMSLLHVDFDEARMGYAQFNGSALWGCSFEKANLSHSSWRGCINHTSDYSEAIFDSSDMKSSTFIKCCFHKTLLIDSNFTSAELTSSEFDEANMAAVSILDADLQNCSLEGSFINGIIYDCSRLKSKSIRVSSAYGSQMFRRDAMDACYIAEFKEKHPFWHALWSVSSDCGRSLSRWALWSVLIALWFGAFFWLLNLDIGSGQAFETKELISDSFLTMLYYSVVTFTTLGFGDVLPKTPIAAMMVMLEVILGYIMLGGLISIFANKLARRSG